MREIPTIDDATALLWILAAQALVGIEAGDDRRERSRCVLVGLPWALALHLLNEKIRSPVSAWLAGLILLPFGYCTHSVCYRSTVAAAFDR
jgi:hypothetical protein